jgi:tripartite-type tricarboxylate transporter receptor subunit TctC
MHPILPLLRAAALGSAVALAPVPAAAADFSGKTIEWVIPFGVGGGSDVWARFVGPIFSKYLPGKPVIVVKNVPGGGSITGTNQFAASAKPDGLTMLGTSGSTQFPYLLGDTRVKFDYTKWHVVLAAPTGGAAYINPKFGVKSVKDLGKLKGQKLAYGSQGATSLDLVPLLGFRMLGLDVNHVFGMKSRGEGRLAFERGEATIDYQTSSAYLKNVVPLIKEGKAVPLFSWGAIDDNGNLVRDPTFPDLPHIGEAYEIVHGKKPSGVEWEAFQALLLAGFQGQKFLVLPEGTPPDIVEAFRAAAAQLLKDQEYQANRLKVLGDYDQVTGVAAKKLYADATKISPAAREWVRDFLTKNYAVKLD